MSDDNQYMALPFWLAVKRVIKMLLLKAASRKLLVFLIATMFLYLERVGSDQWMVIAMIYLGAQGYIDYLKHRSKEKSDV